MTEIIVTGSAESLVPADQASLNASVSLSGEVRDELLRSAGDVHDELVRFARELTADGAASGYSAEAVATYSNSWRDEHGERVVEHRAVAAVRIELTALDRVGEFAAQLTEHGVDVSVSWGLSAALRGEWARRLRGAAVADARVAAEDFAEAISATRLTLVSLRDTPSHSSPLGDARFARAAAAPEVTVGELTVSVRVEASFTAE